VVVQLGAALVLLRTAVVRVGPVLLGAAAVFPLASVVQLGPVLLGAAVVLLGAGAAVQLQLLRDEDEIAFEDFMDGLGSTLDASYTEAEKQTLRQFVSGTSSALKRPAFFFRLSHNYKYLKVNM
jgi:hypothetical protein